MNDRDDFLNGAIRGALPVLASLGKDSPYKQIEGLLHAREMAVEAVRQGAPAGLVPWIDARIKDIIEPTEVPAGAGAFPGAGGLQLEDVKFIGYHDEPDVIDVEVLGHRVLTITREQARDHVKNLQALLDDEPA